MLEELRINEENYKGDQEDYDAIREAVEKLSSASEEQFEIIKKEKWYNRVFDMVTFSQKGKKRLAEQVGTVAQAQQIVIELLLRLSVNDTNISRLVTESRDDIRRIQEQNIFLLSRIKRLENISIGIKPDMDIDNLSEKEKKVLSGCLYKLCGFSGDSSEEQKRYANAVLQYLDIDVQMDNPTQALTEMDNESKRRILTSCMEYMFLKNCTSDDYIVYEDFIEEFDFGKRTIEGIKEQILTLYNLRGCEGFYLKYQSDVYEEVSDLFTLDFEDAVEEMIEVTETEMTEERIVSVMQIKKGETKIFENKKLHINSYINCEGNLELEHCIIYYNETESKDKILLENEARLSIKNSVVVCKGFDDRYFIRGNGLNQILIDSSTFVDCSYFVGVDDCVSFSMFNCEMQNCSNGFLNVFGNIRIESICEISNNKIIQDDICEFNFVKTETIFGEQNYCSGRLIQASRFYKTTFSENNIIEEMSFSRVGISDEDFHPRYCRNSLLYFESDSRAELTNCSFKGLSTSIEVGYVKNCRFENCSGAIDLISYSNDKSVVENCVFINCMDVIDYYPSCIITNCQFVSCYGELIYGNSLGAKGGVEVRNSQFINIKNSEDSFACIQFYRSKECDSKANYLEKCIFDGVEIENDFLIKSSTPTRSEKPSGVIAYINECIFKNCTTKRSSGKIIKEYIQYDTLFKKNQDFQANVISDCHGLNMINKEGVEAEQFELMTVSSDGNYIGAVINIGDVTAYTIGGPVELKSMAGIL